MQTPHTYAEQRGHVYLWKYLETTRNYPEWNLSADDAGCMDGIAFCQELLTGDVRYRSVSITEPMANVLAVPNNRGGRARWWAPRRVRMERLQESAQHPSIVMNENDTTRVVMMLDEPSLQLLQKAFREIRQGNGDCKVNIGGDALWLWWHL